MRERLILIAAVLGALSLFTAPGCGSTSEEVHLSVAASLADVAADWQQDATQQSIHLVYNAGGSATLAQQIIAGAPADLFLSAGPTPVQRLEAAGKTARVDTAYLANRVVIVCRADMTPPRTVFDLIQKRFKRIAVADPAAAPAGEYARSGLTDIGLWHGLHDRLIFTADVRATLAAVSSGAADVGFVYATDAATTPELKTTDSGFPPTHYALAVLAPETPRKTALWDYLHSQEARSIAAKQGFSP